MSNIRLKFPEKFTGEYCNIKNHTLRRWPREIVEVTEEEAEHMYS